MMPDKESNLDLTEDSSKRGNEESTNLARQLESDDVNEGQALGTISTPDGDSAAENRVSTSLSDE